MSGFFGIVNRGGMRPPGALLEKVAAVLSRRGPDGTNVWNDPQFGGCFSLMQTDGARQSRSQPVKLGARYQLVGDIRLDGRVELSKELRQAREDLSTAATDEEVLLRAWQAWGEACLPKLLGDFSFGLWDAEEQRLTCARHFAGSRPFFWAETQSGFCFTNTLGALLLLPDVSRDIDDVFIGDFLLHGFCTDPERTAYRSIHRLAPGHCLRFADGKVEVSRFFKLPIEEPLRFRDQRECIDAFRTHLERAVQDVLPDGPISLLLSGGLDSASVGALALKNTRASLKAFTTSWRPLVADDEARYAAITAGHLHLSHEVIEKEDNVPWDGSESEVAASPEPVFQPFPALGRTLFRSIETHSRVVLSGDGGDDVLTGQAWPYLMFLARRGAWTTIATSMGGFFLKRGRVPPLRGGFRAKANRLLGRDDIWAGYPDWLDSEFEKRARLRERWSDFWEDSPSEHPVHPQAYTSLHSGHWAVVLEADDAGRTGAAVERRTPMLDLRLIRFLLRVPPIPWCVDKMLLREAMKAELPPEILARPKTPLPGNPVAVYLHRWSWKPALPSTAPGPLQHFVNWEHWSATLREPKGSISPADLHPYALLRWLKAVENE